MPRPSSLQAAYRWVARTRSLSSGDGPSLQQLAHSSRLPGAPHDGTDAPGGSGSSADTQARAAACASSSADQACGHGSGLLLRAAAAYPGFACSPLLRQRRHFSGSPSSGPQAHSAPGQPAAAAGQQQQAPPLQPPLPGPILGLLPPSWLPYAHLMRLEKPIGTWLLAWPCFWSIALAGPPGALPDLRMMALFGAGAVLLRGAGCTVNDLWDRELDKQVERTRTRPLAAGLVTPFQAVAFLGAQLLLGLGILVQLNHYSVALGASSLLLVGSYPLMKRVTYWPQAFLGLTFNWGTLLGWAAVQGGCEWGVVLPLYLAGVNWTLVYDTIYAHQDKKDDVKAGIKSTALRFGEQTKPWLSGFAAGCTALLAYTGHAAGSGALYDVGVAAMAAHLAWQIRAVRLDDGRDCMAKFVSNSRAGGLLFAGIAADKLAGSPGWSALLG